MARNVSQTASWAGETGPEKAAQPSTRVADKVSPRQRRNAPRSRQCGRDGVILSPGLQRGEFGDRDLTKASTGWLAVFSRASWRDSVATSRDRSPRCHLGVAAAAVRSTKLVCPHSVSPCAEIPIGARAAELRFSHHSGGFRAPATP